MVNPGAFRGSHKEFLISQKDAYKEAVLNGHVGETVSLIQRCYFKRYPVDLPHNEEPSPEHLAEVNEDDPDPEYEEPDPQKLLKEEYSEAWVKFIDRQKIIEFRKAQIKRWLAYQYMKDNDIDPKDTGAYNPYRSVLFKLTGKELNKPRSRTACNVWRKMKRDVIEEKVRNIAVSSGLPKKGLAALRDKVAREMFAKLSDSEKEMWKERAKKESEEAVANWEHDMKGRCSTKPEDRQRCILSLVRFVKPMLELIAEAMGWKASLLCGGPEPAHGGRLNIMRYASIHCGTTLGDVPLDFGALERVRYKKHFVPIYGSFLRKCYTPEECASRALEDIGDLRGMDDVDLDAENVTLDYVDFPAYPTSPDITQQPSNGRDRAGAATSQDEASLNSLDRNKATTPVTPLSSGGSHSPMANALTKTMNGERTSDSASSNNEEPAVATPSLAMPTNGRPQQPSELLSSGMISPLAPDSHPAMCHVDGIPAGQPSVTPNSELLFNPTPNSSLQPRIQSPPLSPNVSPRNSSVRDLRENARDSDSDTSSDTQSQRSSRSSSPPSVSSIQSQQVEGSITRSRKRAAEEMAGANDSEDSDSSLKRHKGRRRITSPLVVGIPANEPRWFRDVFAMVQGRQLGNNERWVEVVRRWAAFEQQDPFTDLCMNFLQFIGLPPAGGGHCAIDKIWLDCDVTRNNVSRTVLIADQLSRRHHPEMSLADRSNHSKMLGYLRDIIPKCPATAKSS